MLGRGSKGYVRVATQIIGHNLDKRRERHTGPVWQVVWAHPRYGHILASCSYDGKVLIWKEQQSSASGGWSKDTLHTASGECVTAETMEQLLCLDRTVA
ncbi:hypothetical protein JOM56_004938 [Amanita muscaria]